MNFKEYHREMKEGNLVRIVFNEGTKNEYAILGTKNLRNRLRIHQVAEKARKAERNRRIFKYITLGAVALICLVLLYNVQELGRAL